MWPTSGQWVWLCEMWVELVREESEDNSVMCGHCQVSKEREDGGGSSSDHFIITC